MSSSVTLTETTWPSLIGDFVNRLNFYERTAISNEDEYREALQKLCKDPRFYNGIRRQHAQITDFTKAIDECCELKSPPTLNTLVLQLIVKVVQASINSRTPLRDLVKETQKLNDLVPELDPQELRCFPNEIKVQRPLQELFREYMECYLTMLKEFDSSPILSLEPFRIRVTKINDVFQPCVADWKKAVEQTRAEEQQRLATISTSTPAAVSNSMLTQGTKAHFKFVHDLGTGTFGYVAKVMEATSGTFYAQKSIRVRNSGDSRAQEIIEKQVKNEVEMGQRLRHHHIASVLFYVREGPIFNLIMLPVADTDLQRFLESDCIEKGFPRGEITRLDSWFGCLISALLYAHEENIYHGDIKPLNILVKDNRPYLADFGSAKDVTQLQASTSSHQEIAGTPVYWAPETERGKAADVFALGCVFSEMLTVRQKRTLEDYRAARKSNDRENPYAFRKNPIEVRKWLKGLHEQDKLDYLQTLLIEVLEKMLAQKPEDRLNAVQVKKEFRREDKLFCSRC